MFLTVTCVSLLWLVGQGVAQNATCDRAETACSCTMSDGSGTINLQYVETGKPTYKDQVAAVQKDDYLYSWNPCTPFTEGPAGDQDSCTDAAACQISKDQSNFFGLGTHDSAQFAADTDPDSGGLVVSVVYQAASSGRYKDYIATQTTDDYLYSWNPCAPFSEVGSGDPDESCTNVAACQVAKDGSISYGLGTQDSASFTVTDDPDMGQTLTLVYQMPEGGRVSGVILECTQGATTFSAIGEVTVGAYSFQLSSPCACPGAGPGCAGGGLSGGSVFLIILVVLAAVYVIAGAIFMKFVKGAQGSEVIPNIAFWKSLPGYVKDGVFFILSPCRRSKGYESV
ncbi:PREDICTED: uncharacterized protein LOC109469593 [Branchiostoma belcheri]|uniref:Autophagy-related protein 27 n=1 Tax=Branchiostoma belcheri TaxID=7741 RepID=A0A6P4Y3W5_BRABE|nr:PREDICTED: uncharacterized protein LOC109469593 [Branchiostoma belcheri]